MKTVDDYESIRKAYYLEGLSIREISKRLHHSRRLIRKAIDHAQPEGYQLEESRRRAGSRTLQTENRCIALGERAGCRANNGIPGTRSISSCRQKDTKAAKAVCITMSASRGKAKKHPQPICRWNLMQARMPRWIGAKCWSRSVENVGSVQFFVMRLNYSKVRFVMAFPFQKQEAFFEGHIQAFHFLGGVPAADHL